MLGFKDQPYLAILSFNKAALYLIFLPEAAGGTYPGQSILSPKSDFGRSSEN